MERKEINNIARELIEQAKGLSKQKFLNFVEKVYGTDREMWEHLWSVPIATSYETDVILPLELSKGNDDEIIDSVDRYVEKQLGKSEAAFIRINDLVTEFSDEVQDEYFEGIASGEINEEYDTVIVYNEALLKNQFRELLEHSKEVNPPKSEDEVKNIFLNKTAEIFTHERIHLNVDSMVIYSDNPDLDSEFLIKDVQEDVITINGVGNEENYLLKETGDNNEVLVDVVAQIIHTYEEGDSIEDCLYRIIQTRDGKSMYEDIDDREVLALFALFPDELTRWTMFEAYEDQHIDLLGQKQREIFGAKTPRYSGKMLEKIGEYFNGTAYRNMTDAQLIKRKEMLEMLGVRNICINPEKTINKSEISELSNSGEAMEYLIDGERIISSIIEPDISDKTNDIK